MNNKSTTNDPNSYKVSRIVVGLLALVPTGIALLGLRSQFIGLGYNPIGAIIGLVGATAAVLCWWFAFRRHVAQSRRRMGFALVAGIVFGGVGFVGGIAGPLIFAPKANQGPLLGIFITSPLGFVAGAVGGWIYACLRAHRPSVPPEL